MFIYYKYSRLLTELILLIQHVYSQRLHLLIFHILFILSPYVSVACMVIAWHIGIYKYRHMCLHCKHGPDLFNKKSNMKGSTGVLPFIFDAISSNMKGSTPVLPFIFDFLLNKSGLCRQYKDLLLYLYVINIEMFYIVPICSTRNRI